MRSITLASVLFAATLLLVGCSNNENETDIDETREEVKFSTYMDLTVETEPTTRADKTFENDTDLKLVVRDNTNASYFSQKTVTAKAIGTTSTSSNSVTFTDANKLYWDDLGGKNADLKIIGIYPTTANLSGDGITWTVGTDQQTNGVDTYDLMTALIGNYAYGGKGTPAMLDFKHALTKVTINVTSPDFTLEELNKATVAFNVSNSATYNVLTSSFSSPAAVTTVKPLKTEYKVINSETSQEELKGYSFTILTIPFTAGNKLATIVINENEYYVNATSRELKSGVHTNYNVTVSKVSVQVKASITDWETPSGIPVESRIVELGSFVISETDDIKLTEGSTVKMDITDSNSGGVHRTVFEYKSGKWVATTPVYWDDITAPVTKIKALLKLGGIATGEAYLTGEATGTYNVQSAINLGANFFKHPLSKISIIIKTTNGTDKVNLKGIQDVFIPDCGTFKVSETDDLIIVKDGSGKQTVTPGGMNTDETEYICIPAFIYPQTLSGNLCHVTIKEDATNTNVYDVKLSTPKVFEANNHYTYTVTITKSEIKFTAGITDWITDNNNNDIGSSLD